MASALSSLRYGDSLSVVAISGATAVLCEAISWLLIYRTATYNSLRASIERHSRKLDSMKSTSSGGAGGGSGGSGSSSQLAGSSSSRAKKMDRVETSLKDAARELSLAKLKSGAVVAVVLNQLNSSQDSRSTLVTRQEGGARPALPRLRRRGRRQRLLPPVPPVIKATVSATAVAVNPVGAGYDIKKSGTFAIVKVGGLRTSRLASCISHRLSTLPASA